MLSSTTCPETIGKSRNAGKSFLQISFFFFVVTQICFGQWIQINGPYGGSISCLATSGTNLFAGTTGRGVYLSTNNGTNWTAVNTDLTYGYIITLAASGTNLYAGTEDGGVFRSTNNGTNWTAVNTGLTNLDVYSFAVLGSNLFASTPSGVFLSTNNGINWTAINNGLTNSFVGPLAVSAQTSLPGLLTVSFFQPTMAQTGKLSMSA